MNNIYWESFKTFFKIGIFTLGGGYAMIPLIEEEVVNKKQWVTKDEMLDLIAIAQSCPGVFAINIATFIGYKLRKTRGAIATTIGTALPSFLIILLIAIFFHQFEDNKVVAAMFRGIKRAELNKWTLWIPIVSALAIWLLGVSPIWVIIAAGVGGFLWGKFSSRYNGITR